MRERHDGYLAGMAEHGLEPDGLSFSTDDHVETGGLGVAAALAAARPVITAAIAATDRIALGLMAGLTRLGLRTPHDVAVVGFDDVEAGWHSSPPLATVNQQTNELGAQAARLVLAELRGEPVAHRRHTVPSTFLPRKSCGCGGSMAEPAMRGAEGGAVLVEVVLAHLGLPLDASAGPLGGPHPSVDLAALDEVIESTLRALYPTGPSPETLERLTETVIQLIGQRTAVMRESNAAGAQVLGHCVVRISMILARLQAMAGISRADRLSVSLVEQYDVGMGLLGRVGSDPGDLEWLSQVSVRIVCLALWAGPPEQGLMRIAGVYDPGGRALRRGHRAAEPPPVPRPSRVGDRAVPPPGLGPVRGGVPRPRQLQADQRLPRPPDGRRAAHDDRGAAAPRAPLGRHRRAVRRRRVRRPAARPQARGGALDRRAPPGADRPTGPARRARGVGHGERRHRHLRDRLRRRRGRAPGRRHRDVPREGVRRRHRQRLQSRDAHPRGRSPAGAVRAPRRVGRSPVRRALPARRRARRLCADPARGPGPLGAPRPRNPAAGRLPAGDGRVRDDRPPGPVGRRGGLRGDRHLARGLRRTGDRLGEPVAPRVLVPGAAAHRDRVPVPARRATSLPRAGDHRVRDHGRSRGRPADHGRSACGRGAAAHRRLRHGSVLAERPARLPGRRPEDRPVVHP